MIYLFAIENLLDSNILFLITRFRPFVQNLTVNIGTWKAKDDKFLELFHYYIILQNHNHLWKKIFFALSTLSQVHFNTERRDNSTFSLTSISPNCERHNSDHTYTRPHIFTSRKQQWKSNNMLMADISISTVFTHHTCNSILLH